MGERRVANRVLVGKPKGRSPLERLRHRWEDNIIPLPANVENMVSSE